MPEGRARLPQFVSWTALGGGLVLAVSATWWQRGSVAEQQALRETQEILVQQQAATAQQLDAVNRRVATVENAVSRFEERFDWIIELMRQQEARNGYRPPPPPAP